LKSYLVCSLSVASNYVDEKYQVEWVYLTHEVDCELDVMRENVRTAVAKMTTGELWFKMEPPIVSIHCRNVQAASKMLDTAKGGGLKNCGIRSISRADGSVSIPFCCYPYSNR
jgi:tRNA(Phe) wybutosine-synthesizing methylase Tyw3